MDWVTFLFGITAIVLPPAVLGLSLLWCEDTLKSHVSHAPQTEEHTGTDPPGGLRARFPRRFISSGNTSPVGGFEGHPDMPPARLPVCRA